MSAARDLAMILGLVSEPRGFSISLCSVSVTEASQSFPSTLAGELEVIVAGRHFSWSVSCNLRLACCSKQL